MRTAFQNVRLLRSTMYEYSNPLERRMSLLLYITLYLKDFGTLSPDMNPRVAYGFGPGLAVGPRVLEES